MSAERTPPAGPVAGGVRAAAMGARAAVFACMVAALAACNSPPPLPAAGASPTEATVYVYRPRSGVGALGCPRHALDEGVMQSLPYGGAISFKTSPGRHVITTATSWCFIHPIRLDVDVAPGATAFVRFTHSPVYQEGFFRGSGPDSLWTGLEVVTREQARRDLGQ